MTDNLNLNKQAEALNLQNNSIKEGEQTLLQAEEKGQTENTEKPDKNDLTEKTKKNENGSVSLGKFCNAEALLKAYESLEGEFTKKCQKLSDLENKMLGISKEENEKSPPVPPVDLTDRVFIEKQILTNKVIVDRVISEYLRQISLNFAPKTISGINGQMPMTPPYKPKTISEAGHMAQMILQSKN